MFALARRGRHTVNVWPAFVDALASILLVLVFMLLMFVVGQFVLGATLEGRERALAQLNRQVQALAETLSMEQAQRETLLRERAELLTERESAASRQTMLDEQVAALVEEIRRLNAALGLAEAESAAEQARMQAEIERLGERLNVALARRVEELNRYRSEFFGRLRALLGEHPSIRIVGDRFVFQSELLFPSGSATLVPEGERRLAELAATLRRVTAEIPKDIRWVLQVSGHTDRRPISTAQFRSNWELSSARALSVVNFLIERGIPPQRLSAAGYGEFHPVDPTEGEAAYARNRRIEIKLTQP